MVGVLFVELEARFNKPDGIGGGTCDDTGDSRSAEMHPSGLNTIVEGVCYYAFPVAVGGEIDRSTKPIVSSFSFFEGGERNCNIYTLPGRLH